MMASDNIDVGDFRVRWNILRELERKELDRSLSKHLIAEFNISMSDSENDTSFDIITPIVDRPPTADDVAVTAMSDAGESDIENPLTERLETDNGTLQTIPDPVPSDRFVDFSDDDVTTFIRDKENINTLRKTRGDINLVNQFLRKKGENRNMNEICPAELDTLLANFVLSVRKGDGKEFEPCSLRSIISSVDRYFRRHKYGCTIMGHTRDDSFNLTRQALLSKQKDLKQKGKGNRPNRSQPLSHRYGNKYFV